MVENCKLVQLCELNLPNSVSFPQCFTVQYSARGTKMGSGTTLGVRICWTDAQCNEVPRKIDSSV